MPNLAEEREHHKAKAKIYDKLSMFEEMSQSAKNMVMVDKKYILSAEERTLLSFAFKNSVDPDRHRYLQLINMRDTKLDSTTQEVIEELLPIYENKIISKCDELLHIVRSLLLNDQITDENRVIYCKLLGDYLRYKCELKTKEHQSFVREANEAYERGHNLACVSLSPNCPNRLGCVLNYSVFIFEILGLPKDAIKFSKEAIVEAQNDEDSFALNPESMIMVRQLRDNIDLWMSEEETSD